MSFNGATDLHRWKPVFSRIDNIVIVSFNGATDLHRWKRNNILAVQAYSDTASMGPPIYIGGNGLQSSGLQPGIDGFNGATDLHRWKPSNCSGVIFGSATASMGPPIYIGGNQQISIKEITRIFGFNGATDLHRWKQPPTPGRSASTYKLQWGHRFTSVETRFLMERLREGARASMGPPIYIGGNAIDAPAVGVEGEGFNGATDLHRWKQPLPAKHRSPEPGFNGATDLHRWKQVGGINALAVPASMGPPIYIGGNS